MLACTRRFMFQIPIIALLVTSGFVAAAEDYHVEKDVMVPMRDGVRLATDIYRPMVDGKPSEERLPVILSRLPYNKNGAKSRGAYYAKHGYVYVAQDTRGRYASEGVWHEWHVVKVTRARCGDSPEMIALPVVP
ncbi:CocE/NonD family hydrolase, partial [Rosistilla oblonga]|uniref:CocE/NonD family hydrolase n=1 Tax=Rosistilla oblonga TaxID=2527990 RepID=UPI003A984E8B